ncbi:hypothetical protein IPM62_05355 [Candidatus Woesebacteria bacterium]|nr:MAG: hypothetical protein IPM62_05355 [Candidatus Woesebacteria bacterium]
MAREVVIKTVVVPIEYGCIEIGQRVRAELENSVPNGTAYCSDTPGIKTTILGRQCLNTTCSKYSGYR